MANELTLIDASLIENCTCEDVKEEELNNIIALGKEMIDYCFSVGAVGLSAPQIGVFKNMFVYRRTEDSFQVVINPKYLKLSKRPIKVLESCLSYKGKSYLVPRSKEIQAIYFTLSKDGTKLMKKGEELRGEKAIYYQHECDHLSGHTIRTDGVPPVGQNE